MDSTSEDRLLLARIEDAAVLCDKHQYPHFIGFLDERQRAVCEPFVRKLTVTPLFWGGYEDAERTLLGVFPEGFPPDPAPFPLSALSFTYRESVSLSHRDFLGAILAEGIRREKIGDILVTPGYAVVFVSDEVAPFLLDEIKTVGREGVTITEGVPREFRVDRQFLTVRATVASARLDNVVKALTGISREKAAQLIESERVSLNHLPLTSVSKTVCENDLLSIRGVGRFRVTDLSAQTKKGRILLIAQKYL